MEEFLFSCRPGSNFLHEPPKVLLSAANYSTVVDICRLLYNYVAELVTTNALFDGDSELQQLLHMFRLLGIPNEEIWPGVSNFKNWHEFPQWKPRPISTSGLYRIKPQKIYVELEDLLEQPFSRTNIGVEDERISISLKRASSHVSSATVSARALYSASVEERETWVLYNMLPYIGLTSFAVNKICQYMHAPTENHWSAIKRILRYLPGTVEHGMLILRSSGCTLQDFTNVLWKGRCRVIGGGGGGGMGGGGVGIDVVDTGDG
uniref:Cell division control protein 2 homolog D n=1 Tax=Tanacetum cinerariifolium TaxID=118510 RepID=A0A6L2NYY1_TANCI|nr:cell division control protein 2 homolog D [Tanacetum cinerariifolium]